MDDTLIDRLISADPNDDKLFPSLVKESMETLELSDRDVAHAIDISIPSLTRWKNGLSAPHPVLRPHVYKWFIEKWFMTKLKIGQEKKKLPVCNGCGKDGQEDHGCPYREEINNNHEFQCNCCRNCRHECAMDI